MRPCNNGECAEIGYEMSIGDLMAGLLFIFIITLMVFVLNNQRKMTEMIDQLQNSKQLRTEMLTDIQNRLSREGIDVEVDVEHGILHLTEKAVHFASARASLDEGERAKLGKIAEVLASVVPRYAVADPGGTNAPSLTHKGRLESVFIEGHTDNVPYATAQFEDNWDLSARRAIYIYRAFAAYQPKLSALRNTDDFPLFGISGYGESRPRVRYDKPTPAAANRRIDLRFIMTPPRADIDVVKALQMNGL